MFTQKIGTLALLAVIFVDRRIAVTYLGRIKWDVTLKSCPFHAQKELSGAPRITSPFPAALHTFVVSLQHSSVVCRHSMACILQHAIYLYSLLVSETFASFIAQELVRADCMSKKTSPALKSIRLKGLDVKPDHICASRAHSLLSILSSIVCVCVHILLSFCFPFSILVTVCGFHGTADMKKS